MKTIKLEESGDFTLYKEIQPIKSYGTTYGYWKNTKTGENCGQIVYVYEGDDDCYELVVDKREGEQDEQ